MSPQEIKEELQNLSFAYFYYGDQISLERVNLMVEKILNAVVAGGGVISSKDDENETDWGVDTPIEPQVKTSKDE